MPKLTPEGGQILERDALAFDAIERAEVHEGAIQANLGHARSNVGAVDDGRASNSAVPVAVEALQERHITHVACGARHIAALEEDEANEMRQLWTWGEGRGGKLGHETSHDEYAPKRLLAMNGVPLVALACGETWTACFLSDEEVQLFGELDYGSRKLCGENALVFTNTRQDTSPSESFKPL